ncbi:MAG: hypothetical protein JWQ90_924 [Hydrocarboniphaga sp.]|nr:hypothetical protein [Hydrocarboniphaga sp.]
MRNRLSNTLTSWPFLACLVCLLLNDWWLKPAVPSVVTGKLSDFAGIAVVGMVLLSISPTRRLVIFLALSLVFLWWKSSASAPYPPDKSTESAPSRRQMNSVAKSLQAPLQPSLPIKAFPAQTAYTSQMERLTRVMESDSLIHSQPETRFFSVWMRTRRVFSSEAVVLRRPMPCDAHSRQRSPKGSKGLNTSKP